MKFDFDKLNELPELTELINDVNKHITKHGKADIIYDGKELTVTNKLVLGFNPDEADKSKMNFYLKNI